MELRKKLRFLPRAKKRFPFGTLEAEYSLKGGITEEIKFSGDFFGSGNISEFERYFTGCRFRKEEMSTLLGALDIEKYISGCKCEDLLSLLFDN